MHFHNGTTGSTEKYDRYSEAQDRQFEHAKFADVKERFGEPQSTTRFDIQHRTDRVHVLDSMSGAFAEFRYSTEWERDLANWIDLQKGCKAAA
jgi:hypothetical protein